MVRFRVETISIEGELDIQEEKDFLSSAIEYFRSIGADMIIPATTNTIFRTYPDGATAAPKVKRVIAYYEETKQLIEKYGRCKNNGIT